MKAFLDTSVLVATFYADHEHHQPSIDLFLRFGKHDTCCGAHSLAEVYATLTGMPAPRRVSGDQALLFLGNIRDQVTPVALDEHEYVQVTEAAAAAGLAGGEPESIALQRYLRPRQLCVTSALSRTEVARG